MRKLLTIFFIIIFIPDSVVSQVPPLHVFPESDAQYRVYEIIVDNDDFNWSSTNVLEIPSHDPNHIWFTDPNGNHATDPNFVYDDPNNILQIDNIEIGDSLILSFLTATRLVSTNASKALASVSDLTAWIAGTASEIDIANDGDGTVTIGIVDPLIVGKGGTGAATLTDGGILLGSGTGAITALGVAANGQIPIGDGTTDPVLATLTGTTNQVNVTNDAGSITLSTPQDIHTGASPTFAGATLTGNEINIATSQTPATASAAGSQGDIAWDSGYVYVCVASNTWKRSPLTTWGIAAESVIYAGENVIYTGENVVYP